MQDKRQQIEVWDIKRIVIALVIIIALIGAGYRVKNAVFERTGNSVSQGQKGASFSFPSSSLGVEVTQKINSIKEEVTNLSASEIASASPQLQKIIRDIQALEQYPRNQAKDMCFKICGGL